MTEKYFDAVVLGRSVGALAAAALIARRDFRVLVLGQGQLSPVYRLGRHVLHRRAFTMLAASSPVWRKVLIELAQSQTFRRRVVPLDPMVQLLMPGARIELPPEMRYFEREIERELPAMRRVIEELYQELARLNAAADSVFERDAVWPPGGFWERRRVAHQVTALPYARDRGVDLLADLPAAHPYRQLAVALVGFGADLRLDRVPTLAFGRLHGAWTRGLYALPGGEEELVEFLLDRIRAHGGTCRLTERAVRLNVDRRGVRSVMIDGEPSPTGAGVVLSDATGEELADLAQGEGILKSAVREWPRVVPAFGRFVMSLVVRSKGLPDRLGGESIVIPDGEGLALHVIRMRPSDAADGTPTAQRESLLVVEALLAMEGRGASDNAAGGSHPNADLEGRSRDRRQSVDVRYARERILKALYEPFPFLEQHLVAVDSPHDGRPVWVYDLPNGDASASTSPSRRARREVERLELEGGSIDAEPMSCVWQIDPPGYLGLAGEPVRGPMNRTFLVGTTVLPALGQEGQLLAAWSAAGIVTRADRHKERIRRAMWSRVEIG